MAAETTRVRRWQGRPALAWAVRAAIFIVPFVAAMSVAFLLSLRLPVASTLSVQIVRWLAIVAVSTLAMMGVDRLARRFLPLSVLLKLTLVFPDHAPSRFGVAMRTGTTSQLRQRLAAARDVPAGETQQEAAERLLELVGLLSHHDRLTRGHSERVRAYSHLIGEEVGLTESELDKLRWAALLHDVGKTAIDPAILNKPSRLTEDEFVTIKTHPDEGRALVAPLAEWLGDSIQAVWQHHERFDGRGYPQGLSGTDISFAARVVSVADSYDVMTSARSYKKPMSAEAARAELAKCSGTQFDPIAVRAFLNVSLGRLRLMTGPLAWFAQLALFEPSGVVHATSASATSGSGAAGSSVGAASGTGSFFSSGVNASSAAAGSSPMASAAAAAAASGGSAGVASTVAVTAASVVASAVGIAAASPVMPASAASAEAPVSVAVLDEPSELLTPQDTVLVLDRDSFVAPERTDAGQPVAAASGEIGQPGTRLDVPGQPSETTTTTSIVAPPASSTPASSTPTPTAPTPTAPTDVATPSAVTTPTTTNISLPATTAPVADSPPSASVPVETTTTTTTTPSPPTTTIPATHARAPLYLGGGVTAGISAPPFHGVSSDAPLDVELPNVDIDRDDAAGAVVKKDAAGISGDDPTKVLRFHGRLIAPLVIDTDLHIELYVAANDFDKKDIEVEVGLYRCVSPDECTLLGSDTREVKNATKWKKTKFRLRGIDTTIAVGESIEVRAAVLDGSEDDGWFAFGTQEYDAKITVTDD